MGIKPETHVAVKEGGRTTSQDLQVRSAELGRKRWSWPGQE